jgi:hypothetical protein
MVGECMALTATGSGVLPLASGLKEVLKTPYTSLYKFFKTSFTPVKSGFKNYMELHVRIPISLVTLMTLSAN